MSHAIAQGISISERDDLLRAFREECIKLMRLMKDFCADELQAHAIRDQVDLYKEWEAFCNSLNDWLKKALNNKRLKDVDIVGAEKLLQDSLLLTNKTGFFGRISRNEWETKINKIIARTDVSILPVNVQNFIKEADFDNPLRQDPVTGELVPFEGKKPLYLNGMKRLKRKLENKQLPDSATKNNTKKKPREPTATAKKKKNPKQLLKQTRESTAKQLLKNAEYMTAESLGKELGCDKSTASRLDAWKKNRQKIKGHTQKIPEGFKRDHNAKGSDTESIGYGPQEDHYDIKELIEDCHKVTPQVLPTAKAIVAKLSLKDEGEAKRLTKETLHFFPELITNTLE